MRQKQNPAPGATGDGAGFGMRAAAGCGSHSTNNQDTSVATPEQAWERLREAILDRQTNPSTENALRVRRFSDALVVALNDGRTDIAAALNRYAALDPVMVEAVGGDRFAPAPLHEVTP